MKTIFKDSFATGATIGRIVANERVIVRDTFGREITGRVVSLSKRPNGKTRAHIAVSGYTLPVDVKEYV